jgi:uncharacterized protein (TIGR00290 family)
MGYAKKLLERRIGAIKMIPKAIFTWSGGKDSAMALHQLQKAGSHEIAALLTTVTEDYDRISMHGVQSVLLGQQAESLGIPVEKIHITKESPNYEYESKLESTLTGYKDRGISSVVFGDIFLEDLRRYREENLSRIGMKGIFPIWNRDTGELARTFISMGFKAVVTCVDSKVLDKGFAGREFDEHFLSDLPKTVDPCGENGEFHSFVYDGPIFHNEILHSKGEIVFRDDRFCYCDLIPGPCGI